MKKLIYLGILLLTFIGIVFAEPDIKTTECQERINNLLLLTVKHLT